MKITRNDKGKFVVDFEGMEIDVSDVDSGNIGFISDLFSDKVSFVMNGIWRFNKDRVFNDVFQKGSHMPTDNPEHVYCQGDKPQENRK